MDGDEEQRQPGREDREDHAEVHGQVHHQQHRLQPPVPHGRALQRAEAPVVQVEPFEREQREEHVRLPASHPAAKPAALQRLLLCPHQSAGPHVRVFVFVVGVGVVASVLVHPPAVAEAGGQVAGDEAGHLTRSARAEHLAVACVVAEERHLRGGHGEEYAHEQLPP
jgi:hypothetical protein